MPYRLKLILNTVQKKINMIWQYAKTSSFYLREEKKNFFS